MTKSEMALHRIDPNGVGLEIGPSFDPIAPKRDGFNVEICDHCSAEELKRKYDGHGVDIDNIEQVDHIWRGEPLDELIGKHGHYDYIIASHVIEHTPDLIGFVNQCERLLKSDGVLSLVIPDKRFTFDYFKPLTTTGDIVQAHLDGHRIHALGTLFDDLAYTAVKTDGSPWGDGVTEGLDLERQFSEVKQRWEAARGRSEYIDIHNWIFVPANFRLAFEELHAMGMIRLRELCFFDTVAIEFAVALSSDGPGCPHDRLSLLRQMARCDVAHDLELVRENEFNATARQRAQAERDALRRELDALRNSLSWKISAPLRWVRRRLPL